jgi:hypothetical protein
MVFMTGPGRRSPVSELLKAARLEVAAELRSDGGNGPKASLNMGRRLSAAGEEHTYDGTGFVL